MKIVQIFLQVIAMILCNLPMGLPMKVVALTLDNKIVNQIQRTLHICQMVWHSYFAKEWLVSKNFSSKFASRVFNK